MRAVLHLVLSLGIFLTSNQLLQFHLHAIYIVYEITKWSNSYSIVETLHTSWKCKLVCIRSNETRHGNIVSIPVFAEDKIRNNRVFRWLELGGQLQFDFILYVSTSISIVLNLTPPAHCSCLHPSPPSTDPFEIGPLNYKANFVNFH